MPYITNLSEDRPDSTIEQVLNKVISDAEAKFDKPYANSSKGLYPVGNELGRIPLRPSHFYQATGLPEATYHDEWTTPVYAAAGLNTWFNSKTPEEVFIIIEGIFNETLKLTAAESAIHAFKPTLGGTELPWVNIDILDTYREPWGYFEFPMVLSPETVAKFELLIDAAVVVKTERIGLVGDVIGERNSLIIQQP